MRSKADAAVERLHALNAEARRFAELIEPMVVNFCHGLTDSAALSAPASPAAAPLTARAAAQAFTICSILGPYRVILVDGEKSIDV